MERFTVYVDPALESIMDRFLAIRRRELEEMEAALAAGDMDSLRLLGHRMKGCCTSYGMPCLSELGAIIEEAAKSEKGSDAAGPIAQVADYLDNVDIQYVEPDK